MKKSSTIKKGLHYFSFSYILCQPNANVKPKPIYDFLAIFAYNLSPKDFPKLIGSPNGINP